MIQMALAAIAQSLVAQRTIYNFDSGWKFHLGNVQQSDDAMVSFPNYITSCSVSIIVVLSQCLESAWTSSLDGLYCKGWARHGAYDLTAEECRLYCCGDPDCAGYTYGKGFCLVGNDLAGCVNSSKGVGFAGAGRQIPAAVAKPPPSGPQTPLFNDASWQEINTPHDFVVEQVGANFSL
jgi:hypothetical protein